MFSPYQAENFYHNVGYLQTGYKAFQLLGKIPSNVPAFVVSAGPSLNKNIKELKRAKGKSFIIAVDTAVLKGIIKVSKNPLPPEEGGYGKSLGNKRGTNLTNLMKIKFRELGIRVVYKIERVDGVMKIIVVSARADEQVYKEAAKRREKHDL